MTIDRIRTALQSVAVDVVFLQEVLGEQRRFAARLPDWPVAPQFEYLADTIWPYYAYGKNAVYNGGHHGNAILSKFPIASWENIDFSNNRFERRGCLHAVIYPTDHQPLHCLCVHLDLLHRGRIKQVLEICRRINEAVPEDEPFILAGDFNDWSRRLSCILEEHTGATEVFRKVTGKYAATYPSACPVLNLDRMYFRGVTAVSAQVLSGAIWRGLSDHRPIVGEVRV